MTEQIDALIEFREVVGRFPRKPISPRPPVEDGYVAFKEAWEAKRGFDGNKAIPGTAWLAYKQVLAGTLGDGEGQTEELWGQQRKNASSENRSSDDSP